MKATYRHTPRGVVHAVVLVTTGRYVEGAPQQTVWTSRTAWACNMAETVDLADVVDGMETCKNCRRVYWERQPVAELLKALA